MHQQTPDDFLTTYRLYKYGLALYGATTSCEGGSSEAREPYLSLALRTSQRCSAVLNYSRNEQEAIAAAIAGARLVVQRGAGHLLHVEEPERFASDLMAFIDALIS